MHNRREGGPVGNQGAQQRDADDLADLAGRVDDAHESMPEKSRPENPRPGKQPSAPGRVCVAWMLTFPGGPAACR
jgi:cytochrome c553